MVFWRGGKGPKESWGRGWETLRPISTRGQRFSLLPRSRSSGLTYPPESSKKNSGGGEAGGGKEGARNLSRSPLKGSAWEVVSP